MPSSSLDGNIVFEPWDPSPEAVDDDRLGLSAWDVVYRAQWICSDQFQGQFSSPNPIELSKPGTTEGRIATAQRDPRSIRQQAEPALEITTAFTSPREHLNDSTSVRLSDIPVSAIVSTKIVIRSRELLDLLHKHTRIVTNLTDGPGPVPQYVSFSPHRDLLPYHMVLRHLIGSTKLIRGPVLVGSEQTELTISPTTVCQIMELVKVLEEQVKSNVIMDIDVELDRQTPRLPYECLWYVFPPGSVVYTAPTINDHESSLGKAYLVDTMEESDDAWHLTLCSIRRDQEDGISDVWKSSIEIPRRDGARALSDLGVFPAAVWDRLYGDSRRRSLVKRGIEYIRMAYSPPQEMFYDGPVFTCKRGQQNRRFRFRGRIVVDHEAMFVGSLDEPRRIREHLGNHGERSNLPFEWFDPGPNNKLSPDEKTLASCLPSQTNLIRKGGSLSELAFLIMDNVSLAFGVSDKMWMGIELDCTKPIERIPNPMQSVIIDKEAIEMIEALSFRQHKARDMWTADLINGKGNGQIILLHGPPGTGKTYTVECIAESFHKPLLSLSIANVGTQDDRIETELDYWFLLAERWNAVLLLDEADVFLERRRNSDLQRNVLVAALLRRIEYFSGLLFLTTNRVGQLDDAFASRINVIIEYKTLKQDARKQIWEAFFTKLDREKRSEIVVGHHARQYVLNSQEIQERRWNGREIRNALQTAIALAEYEKSKSSSGGSDPVIVEENHFRQVMRMSQNFQHYMMKIAKADEAERALARKDRYDDSDSEH